MRLKIGVQPLQWVQCEFLRSGFRVSLLWAFVTPLFTSFLSLFFCMTFGDDFSITFVFAFSHDLWWDLKESIYWLSTTTFQRPASFWSLLVSCRLSQVVLSFSMSRFLPQTSNRSRFWSLSHVLLCLGLFSSKFNLEEVWIWWLWWQVACA
jgi:hypothetical protein